jgi:hypothetical protein
MIEDGEGAQNKEGKEDGLQLENWDGRGREKMEQIENAEKMDWVE